MLKWLSSDWMPGYTGNGTDFRKLDVSRRIQTNHVNGLTSETVVGLIANLTSLELCREEYILRGLPPEHPRSGTSDDVECFISVLHEMLGDIFDLKDFYASFPKIMNEFYKRISRDTRFYYLTGRKHRFRNFALQSFNEPSQNGIERLDRTIISRRADPGVFVATRGDFLYMGQQQLEHSFTGSQRTFLSPLIQTSH